MRNSQSGDTSTHRTSGSAMTKGFAQESPNERVTHSRPPTRGPPPDHLTVPPWIEGTAGGEAASSCCVKKGHEVCSFCFRNKEEGRRGRMEDAWLEMKRDFSQLQGGRRRALAALSTRPASWMLSARWSTVSTSACPPRRHSTARTSPTLPGRQLGSGKGVGKKGLEKGGGRRLWRGTLTHGWRGTLQCGETIQAAS